MSKNSVFDLSSPLNRDKSLEPYVSLRDRFAEIGIRLETVDLYHGGDAAFELHLDIQPHITDAPRYALLLENPHVRPANGVPANWIPYRKIFTWCEDLIDGTQFLKINLPNVLDVPAVDGSERIGSTVPWTSEPPAPASAAEG